MESNRTPDIALQKEGVQYLLMIKYIFPEAKIYPVGRVAENILDKYNMEHGEYIRHPAHGGSNECEKGLVKIL